MKILAETEKIVSKSTGVKILKGKEAEKLLTSPDFIKKWDILYQKCSWATVFQSSKLVTTWYQSFKELYLFIISYEEKDDELTGLLIMVQDIGHQKIYVAGGTEAEYQTWLADSNDDTEFIEKALINLRSMFPNSEVNMFNMPPNTPLDWVKTKQWSSVCEVTADKRHLMNLTKEDAPKLFRKQQFREKRNRLKRLGELTFEHITTLDRFVSVLPELMDQYDFRKGSKYNLIYFRSKPASQNYFIELFKHGLLHATILKLDQEIIASLVGQIDDKWLCLGGINTHSPFYGLHSPGYVHFLMLGQHLMEDGYEVFDLTPGNDPYKFRIANEYDVVHSLCFTSQRKAFVKKKIVNPLMQFAKNSLSKQGVDIRELKESLAKSLERVRQNKIQGAASALTQLLPSTWKNEHTTIYEYSVSDSPLTASEKIEVNSYANLLDFDENEKCVTRWDFLDNAMQRFEVGDKAFTYVKDKRLVCCVWQGADKHILQTKLGNEHSDLLDNTLLINSIYFHTGLTDKETILQFILHKLIELNKPTKIYTLINSMDNKLSTTFKNVGFIKVA